MKNIIAIILVAFMLVACATAERKAPTPFTTTPQTLQLQGCIDLHKAVKEWNELNPTKEPRIADC